MNAKQLKKYIIEPVLFELSNLEILSSKRYKKLYSEEAVKLLLMTAAVESNMGEYLVQNNNAMAEDKKAVSIYQIEKPTIDFVLKRKLNPLRSILDSCIFDDQDVMSVLISNLNYATIFCRCVYWYKTKDPIPNHKDNDGLWKYYKKWYNSSAGATTKDKFFNACKRHKLL